MKQPFNSKPYWYTCKNCKESYASKVQLSEGPHHVCSGELRKQGPFKNRIVRPLEENPRLRMPAPK